MDSWTHGESYSKKLMRKDLGKFHGKTENEFKLKD
jgi:hypothetical protein